MSGGGAARETAYAKINLALHVRERLPDGYHAIETLFAFCADGDKVVAEPAPDLTLAIDGPFAKGLEIEGNLVLRAAEALRAHFDVEDGAKLHLTKHLPIASGIGGGSADAAAALRALARLWDISLDEVIASGIAAKLGADVPACLLSKTCMGTGRGDALRLVEAPELADLPILLANPGVAVSTPQIFARWDGEDRGPVPLPDPVEPDPRLRNDLTAPARAIESVIGDVIDHLSALDGARFVRMSGSGATCFALFDDDDARDAAKAAVDRAQPEWWSLSSTLR